MKMGSPLRERDVAVLTAPPLFFTTSIVSSSLWVRRRRPRPFTPPRRSFHSAVQVATNPTPPDKRPGHAGVTPRHKSGRHAAPHTDTHSHPSSHVLPPPNDHASYVGRRPSTGRGSHVFRADVLWPPLAAVLSKPSLLARLIVRGKEEDKR
ncbi:hypothetical protein BHE74_00046968 [Ensete ventricosum]|nr:hypothetical protein BHE74_00046968 [Ensete ventricosum]